MGFKVVGVDLVTLGPLVVRYILGTQGRSGPGPLRGRCSWGVGRDWAGATLVQELQPL